MILCENCSPRLSCFVYQNGDTRTKCEFYQPMTEKEYLQTCTTEYLAEVITDIRDNDIYANNGILEPLIMKLVGVRDKELRKSIVVEWLKQPHKENE